MTIGIPRHNPRPADRRPGPTFWLALAAYAGLLMLVLFPLRIALDLVGAAGLGLNARAIGGTIWWGGLGEAHLGAIPLGVVETRFAPAGLLKGQLAFDLRPFANGPTQLSARAALGPSGWSLSNLNGRQSAEWLGSALPVQIEALNYKNAALAFDGSGCLRASGVIEASLSGTAPVVTGRLGCTGKRLTVRFDLPGGQAATPVWNGRAMQMLPPGADPRRLR